MLQQWLEKKEAEGEQAQSRLVGEGICPNNDQVTGQICGSWLAWMRTGYDKNCQNSQYSGNETEQDLVQDPNEVDPLNLQE